MHRPTPSRRENAPCLRPVTALGRRCWQDDGRHHRRVALWLESFSTAEDQRFSVFMPRSAVKDALAKLEAAGCPKDASINLVVLDSVCGRAERLYILYSAEGCVALAFAPSVQLQLEPRSDSQTVL